MSVEEGFPLLCIQPPWLSYLNSLIDIRVLIIYPKQFRLHTELALLPYELAELLEKDIVSELNFMVLFVDFDNQDLLLKPVK